MFDAKHREVKAVLLCIKDDEQRSTFKNMQEEKLDYYSVYSGNKSFWKPKMKLEIVIFVHRISDIVEVLAYSACTSSGTTPSSPYGP